MKKIHLLFLVFLFSQSMLSQTERGRYLLDASSNFSIIGTSPYDNIFGFEPELETDFYLTAEAKAGYAVVKNLFLGPTLSYEYVKYKSSELNLSSIYYGVFAQYFIVPKENAIALPYLVASYSVGKDKVDGLPSFEDFPTSFSQSTSSYTLGIGTSLMLIPKRLSIDFEFNYSERDLFIFDQLPFLIVEDTLKTYQFNVGFSVFL